MDSDPTRIVGREVELGRLADFLDDQDSRTRAVIIEGEAGAGKTTLWLEALRRAADRTFTVLDCRPAEPEAKLSYQALSDLFEPVLDVIIDHLPAPQARALELALAGGSAESFVDHRPVYTGTHSVLRQLSRSAPVLLAVDDLQRLDGPSERALGFAVRRLRDDSVAIMGTRRTDLGPYPGSALWEALRELSPERMRVGPLSLGAIQRLVAERLSFHVPRPLLTRIHHVTGGNPLFALEVADALSALEDLPTPSEPLPVPDDIRDLVHARLDKLPARTREALLVVALASKPTEALLARVVGDDWAARLDRARWAGVFAGGETLKFSHPLFGSVVESSSDPTLRRTAHAKLATAVDEEEARARHLALSATEADSGIAAALEVAAARTHARGAPDAAAELVELARRLTPPGCDDDLGRRSVAAAEYSFAAGETERALNLLQELVASTDPGPQRADLLRRVTTVQYHRNNLPAALANAQQALVEAGDDEALALSIEKEILFPLNVMGDLDSSREHALHVVELSERLDDPAGIAHGLAVASLARFMLGGGVDHEAMRRIFEVDTAASPAIMDARGVVSHILAWTGSLDDAREIMDGLRRRVLDEGDEGALPGILFRRAYIEVPWGDWSLAARYAEEGEDVCRRTGQETFLSGVLSIRAFTHTLRGDYDLAKAVGNEGMALGMASSAMLGVMFNTAALGFLASARGDAAETDAHLGPMLEAMKAGGAEPVVMWWLPDEVEALIALGESGRAESVTGWVEERARTSGSKWALAIAARCRALVCASKGDWAGAAPAFDEALEQQESRLEKYELARTLLAKGRAARRARKWGVAQESLQRALGVFDELDAVPWAEQARGELKRIGGRPSSPLELTETERKVAELVALGMSNKRVADALFMSARTVQSNLSRVYRKLGIRSRSELASQMSPRDR